MQQCSLHRKNRFDSSPTRNKPNHAAHIAVPTESKTNGNDATKLQKPIEPNRGGPPAVAYVRTRRTRSLLRDKPHVKHLGRWAPERRKSLLWPTAATGQGPLAAGSRPLAPWLWLAGPHLRARLRFQVLPRHDAVSLLLFFRILLPFCKCTTKGTKISSKIHPT
jgi:hypothetical protein